MQSILTNPRRYINFRNRFLRGGQRKSFVIYLAFRLFLKWRGRGKKRAAAVLATLIGCIHSRITATKQTPTSAPWGLIFCAKTYDDYNARTRNRSASSPSSSSLSARTPSNVFKCPPFSGTIRTSATKLYFQSKFELRRYLNWQGLISSS